jgi:hypothetical protein
MGRRLVVLLTDDIDGGEAVEALTFALRDIEYEIDLNAKNVAALEEALQRYVAAARRIPSRKLQARTQLTRADAEISAMRMWGRANGYRVGNRGRIPLDLRAAFNSARGQTA